MNLVRGENWQEKQTIWENWKDVKLDKKSQKTDGQNLINDVI